MTSPNVSSRRLLSLPAIRPCESISPSVLLHSLISLADDIGSHNPTRNPTHRALIRESLRHVSVLLLLFHDLLNGSDLSFLPSSAILSLSELHVILQKLRSLIHDLSAKGGSLWVLMNSDRVGYEFQNLTRAIAVALDVFPVDQVNITTEIKDAVSLLSKQTWKTTMKHDEHDSIEFVSSAITRFANGLHPDHEDLTCLLRKLNIRSWSDCGDEIHFLEDMVLNGESALAEELTALLIYSRAVLFKVNGIEAKKEVKAPEVGIDGIDHDTFRCPISLDTMTDPVTVSTGMTYDRASITRWVTNGCMTCPVTGEKLRDTDFVPNSSLKRIISKHVAVAESTRNKRDLTKTASPRSTAAAGAVRMTVEYLVAKLSSARDDEKDRAAYEIRLISKSSIFVRACLVEADCVAWLLHLVSAPDPSMQDNAVAALLNLSKHAGGRAAIFEVGGVRVVVEVIENAIKTETKQNAAAILFYLSSVEEYRYEIGQIAIPSLVTLLKSGTYRGKKNAVVAIFGLLLHPSNHHRVLAAGATRALITLLTSEHEDLVNDCVGVLAKIAERKEGTAAILKVSADVMVPIVDVMTSSSSRSAREYCVSMVLSLINNGGAKVVAAMEKMSGLMPALYSVVGDGSSPAAAKKARAVINCIHQINDQDYAMSTPATVQDHRVVHAL